MPSNNSRTSNPLKRSLGTIAGASLGGYLGNKLGNRFTKEEEEKLKQLTSVFMMRLRRQPRMYSLFVQIEQYIKDSSVLPSGEDRKNMKKTVLILTQKLLTGLTDTDKKLYLEIQHLTDKVYSKKRGTIITGVTLGGIIGLILGGKL